MCVSSISGDLVVVGSLSGTNSSRALCKQLVGLMGEAQGRPFNRFLRLLQDTFNHPIAGPFLGPLVVRLMGVDPRVIKRLYTEEDERRVRRMSAQELADETLAMKGAAA